MARLYLLIFVIGIIGIVGYGAKYYYDTTQNRIAVLTKNNTKLKVAIETSEKSISELKTNITKMANLNKSLQVDLQKAEAYKDELRSKLSKLDLVVEALKDSKVLEGKMNGASYTLWQGIMEETGNINKSDKPSWLQRPENGTGNKDGNKNRTNSDTSSSETKAIKP
ncbi:MAG: hypothetical protein HKN86_00610 [Acidimicrobiia bacterium]|nr:hypothetical protein [Acidimicrobiia bacterium]